jgi:hypothetical protein
MMTIIRDNLLKEIDSEMENMPGLTEVTIKVNGRRIK